MSKISKYFSEKETTVSSTGDRLGIKNIPNEQEKKNILYTANRMDKVREYLGVGLMTLSWFRCEELNNAVGGSKTSAHRFGLAVDVYSGAMSAREIFERLVHAQKKGLLSFDQIIYYPKQNFVHCGFKLNESQERGMFWETK